MGALWKNELRSCRGVLLRARPSHSFWQMGLVGHALLDQPSKGHPYRILCSTPLLPPNIKENGDLFCPVHICGLSHSVKKSLQKRTMFLKCKFQNSTSKTGRCHLFGVFGILESGSPLKVFNLFFYL